MMEKNLEKTMEEAFRIPGVAGVLCADSHGLCLSAKGNASKDSAGHVTNLARQAAQLHPNATSSPVITVESDGGTLLVKSESDITMAIYKTPS